MLHCEVSISWGCELTCEEFLRSRGRGGDPHRGFRMEGTYTRGVTRGGKSDDEQIHAVGFYFYKASDFAQLKPCCWEDSYVGQKCKEQ